MARPNGGSAIPPSADHAATEAAAPAVARRTALWQLGVAAPGITPRNGQGTQLSLPLDLPAAPELKPLADWDRLVADYATTGVTIDQHPMKLLREELRERGAVSCRDLDALPHGARVRIGGLVMARQRPGTAKGVTFLLLEDEFGTINLIAAPPIYERHRLVIRSEPLVIADGTLERFATAGGAVNIVIRSIAALEAPDRRPAEVVELEPAAGAAAGAGGGAAGIPDAAREFPPFDSLELARRRAERAAEREAAEEEAEREAVAVGGGARRAAAARGRGDFRAVAPPVLSFTQGRRR